MRIVIDMQGAQSLGSRNRGIGRYTIAIVKSMVRNGEGHDFVLALNGQFQDTLDTIRRDFADFLPQENIRIWHMVAPVAACDCANDWRRQAAELTYEAFLGSLKPDCIYITSLFEGLGDDAVTSIHGLLHNIPVAVILYDLIPYIYPQPYLDDHNARRWYQEKIQYLQRADLCLAISESSRREGIQYLGLSEEWTVNISTDADNYFCPIEIPDGLELELRKQYGLFKPFILYTGGIDHRKNIEGLIRAYALLPLDIRQTYQLAIVCSIQPYNRSILESLVRQQGLTTQDVIFTGFVPDEDLRAFYNLCELFVFPSWHEGFGLPILEAMRCNALVIGANTSSIPEVIGWDEALFDPHSDAAIVSAMQRGLTDTAFRINLSAHIREQARKFSWVESGYRAIQAMERMVDHWHMMHRQRKEVRDKLKLAYVSPLPPAHCGIADYSAELLPELAKFYVIDVIVSQDTVISPWITENCSIHSVQWLVENADSYDRVLYHFGNSSAHRHMFGLLEAVPGVVVLHDFFLSGIIENMHGISSVRWKDELYKEHGYVALYDQIHALNVWDPLWKYPCSLSVIQNSLGLIVHSQNSLRLATQWYGGNLDDWEVIPLLRNSHTQYDKVQAHIALGFSEDDFIICAFGLLGPTKLNHRLLDAWFQSSLHRDKTCHLIFVGENHKGDYGQNLLKRIRHEQASANVSITGWVDAEVFHQYLAAADICVQLRTLSRGETSATVLDCMNYGKATIVNANGSMADLDDNAVWKLPDNFSDEELVKALETLRQDSVRRQKMGERAREIILTRHDPAACAEQYRNAIESFYKNANANVSVLAHNIMHQVGGAPDKQLQQLAAAMAKSFTPRNCCRQLLVDISELVRFDSKSGIQRVVRSILTAWLEYPPKGFRVEPVYATTESCYYYAHQFTTKLMGFTDNFLQDTPIDYALGDIFFGLDFQMEVAYTQRSFYRFLRNQGICVKFLLHDILPITMPEYVSPENHIHFKRWLDVVTENDGAICVSRTVAEELSAWVKENVQECDKDFEVTWSHNGADIDRSLPTQGMPDDAGHIVAQLRSNNSFLMVGTLELRKGYPQVLDAFEQLWQQDIPVILVIVGRRGWDTPDMIKRILSHPQCGKCLVWLERISDEYLEEVYHASTCLIAASYGEGFGLPLIEAAHHNLPIIARDIPVFREVAGEHAYYFKADNGAELAEVIKKWLTLYEKNQHPKSDDMPWLTWKQSAGNLMKLLITDLNETQEDHIW